MINYRTSFARRLGELLDVPVITCEPAGKPEFHYPQGDRDKITSAGNDMAFATWKPGQAILGVMGGNVAAVDVDPRNSGDVDQVRELLTTLSVRIFAEVETPGGGRHFYVAGHPELASAHNLDHWPGIDIQSFGSLLFLPGTQRPKYGGAGYEIVSDNLDALADGGDPDGSAALAGWVADHRGGREGFEPSEPWDGRSLDHRQIAWLKGMLDGIHTELSVMGKDSGRNNAVYNRAMRCGSFVAGAGLDEDRAITMLLDASERNGLIKEDGRESVLASVRSGIRNGKTRPCAVPESKVQDHEPPDDWMPDDDPYQDRDQELDYAAVFALDVEREARRLRIREAAERKIRTEQQRALGDLDPIDLADFLAVPDKSTVYRIDGLWPSGGRVMLAAQHKAGKTTMVGNVLRSLADGSAFLGQFRTEPARVILLDFEMHEDHVRKWLRDQRIARTGFVTVRPLRGKVSSFDILDGKIRSEWATRLRGHEVAIFDCLRPILDALGLDEHRDAGRLLIAIDELINEAGIPETLIIHHMGHSNERGRGDSRIIDWPEANWKLVRENEDEASPRYFSAYGRDVNQREALLDYDHSKRRLTLTGGSRKEASERRKDSELRESIFKIMHVRATLPEADRPDCTGTYVEHELRDLGVPFQRGDERKVLTKLVESGELVMTRKGNAKLYNLPTSPEPPHGETGRSTVPTSPPPYRGGEVRGGSDGEIDPSAEAGKVDAGEAVNGHRDAKAAKAGTPEAEALIREYLGGRSVQ
jgi:hypothetical protein